MSHIVGVYVPSSEAREQMLIVTYVRLASVEGKATDVVESDEFDP